MTKWSVVASVLAAALQLPVMVRGHGYMYTPRSLNWAAYQDGTDNPSNGVPGVPTREYCYHCLNTKDEFGVCGKTTTHNYDNYFDTMGNAMPWSTQATYTEGQVITIKSHLSTNHLGHMEMRVCPSGETATQECFDSYLMEFISDPKYGAPKDVNYPERGYYTPTDVDFEMEYQLPMGVTGEKVLMQWIYVTANSCNPPGYRDYPFPSSSWWQGPNLGDCVLPYNPTGARTQGSPELFWNCAEITILPSAPTISPAPTAGPTMAAPVVPVADPTRSPNQNVPSAGLLSCSNSPKTSYQLLQDMQSLTYTVSSNPYTLSIIAEGGAAGSGSVVSEGQGYGLLTAAIALSSLDYTDTNRADAMNKFYGYFNGWKKMCQNSTPYSSCQSIKYCGGAPCLPGWKHSGDLASVIGTGAAPDGDEDAIIGMIIALKSLEDDPNQPSWYDSVRKWTDESCTQFLADNTVLSSSGYHRLLKLGSCWGGWGSNGNNPSYPSPGAFRAMRDFHLSYDGTRSYTMPSFGDSLGLEAKWNMLIDTTYKFYGTTQCPDTGLVPNWALVTEVDSYTLAKQSGSFSGSGTPQYEFGAEASRTMWRVAFDAAMYPDESAADSGAFLAPVHNALESGYDAGSGQWQSSTLQPCTYVSNVFGSWLYNGFIYGPVLSTLAIQSASMTAAEQQVLVDAACTKVSSLESSYYPRSWQVISLMTLSGDVARAGALLRDQSPTTRAPVPPTMAPVTSAPAPIAPTATSSPSRKPSLRPTATPVTSLPVPVYECCSWDYKNCGSDSYCNASAQNCAGCNGFWTDSSPKQCLALWVECTNNINGCCSPASCVGDSNTSGGYKQCMPSPPTAPSPVATPPTAPSPVAAPPTSSPVAAPVGGVNKCCSWNYDTCPSEWCNQSQANCVSCGGGSMWLDPADYMGPSPTCCTWNADLSCPATPNDYCDRSQTHCENQCGGTFVNR